MVVPVLVFRVTGLNHPLVALASLAASAAFISVASEPRIVLILGAKRRNLGWNGKLPGAGERLAMGTLMRLMFKHTKRSVNLIRGWALVEWLFPERKRNLGKKGRDMGENYHEGPLKTIDATREGIAYGRNMTGQGRGLLLMYICVSSIKRHRGRKEANRLS